MLYLNSLPSEVKGGSLDIFKLKNDIIEKPARPKKDMCEKIESIEPKPGRLVIFRNDETSYHSVKNLKTLEAQVILGALFMVDLQLCQESTLL